MKKQDFKVLKTKDLYPFPDNPFHVAEDETLSELAESIKGIWHCHADNHTPERGRERL